MNKFNKLSSIFKIPKPPSQNNLPPDPPPGDNWVFQKKPKILKTPRLNDLLKKSY